MRLFRLLTSLLLFWLISTVPVFACPLCDSATGKLVREGVFNRQFGVNLLLVLAPFPVCLLIGVLLYYGFPKRKYLSPPANTD